MSKANRNFEDAAMFEYPDFNILAPEDFYRLYKGYIYSIARKEGMDDYYIQQIIDDIMVKIYVPGKKPFKYDKTKGKFTSYLGTVVKNSCYDIYRINKYVQPCSGEELEDKVNNFHCSEQYYMGDNEELASVINNSFLELGKQVRSPLQIQVLFRMLKGERPIDIAADLNIRADYVSLAKNRLLPKLQQIVRRRLAA